MPNGSSKIPIHQLRGWTPVFYDPTFAGTGLYQKSVEGWVLNGDTILLSISRNGHERLRKEIRDRYESQVGAIKEEFHIEGERSGVTTYEENRKSGARELN
jgi:hypothetical protein